MSAAVDTFARVRLALVEQAEADRVAALVPVAPIGLYVPDVHGKDVLGAALDYAAAGWYVLPVKPGTKNPGSVVGTDWPTRSSRDPQVIAGWFAGCEAGTGIALHAGRSGAVVLDVDNPAALPDMLRETFHRYPTPVQRTRAGDPGNARGHVLYLMPPGRTVGNSLGQLARGWGDVRGANGVIVVAPSLHEKHADGGLYGWARAGMVAPLPDVVADLLVDAAPGEHAATSATVAAFLRDHVAGVDGRVGGPCSRFTREVARGESRHSAVLASLVWGAKEARAGILPAPVLVDTLRAMFLDSLADASHANGVRPGGDAEYDACLAWAVGQALALDDAGLADVVTTANRDTAVQRVDPPPAQVPATSATRHVDALDASPGSATPDEDTETVGATWGPFDITPTVAGLLAGTLDRPAPTVGALDGGGHLLYAGKVNGIAGESGCGKSWTALLMCAQEMRAGQHVLYIDLEDDPASIVTRLLDIGAEPGVIVERFTYVRPDEHHGALAHAQLVAVVERYDPSLVVIDSTGEGMAIDGAKPNDDDDVARWFRKLPTALARLGAAVLVLDHVVKSGEGGLWPIGSQRKRAAISGAQYMQSMVAPFSETVAGSAKLVCAKDRHGAYAIRQTVATLAVTPTRGQLSLVLKSVGQDGPATTFRPTALMQRTSIALETAGEPLTRNGVTGAVTGKAKTVVAALAVLIVEGYVGTVPGTNRSTLHHVVKPYREVDDPASDRFDGGTHLTDQNDDECVRFLERGTGTHPLSASGTHQGRTGTHLPDEHPEDPDTGGADAP